MRSKSEIIALLTQTGVIAVVRVEKTEQVLPTCEALAAGGVIALEITLTIPNALSAIREASRHFGARALIGAGTVLNAPDCHAALEAGAEFIVSPISKTEIVEVAHAADRPVMLGAYTPTEAQLAHEAGADFIKIFPADGLGPSYIKALRAPLPHLRLIPTGLAKAEDVPAFIKAGCVAVGLGSLLVPLPHVRDGNWPELTRRAKEFVQAVREARSVR